MKFFKKQKEKTELDKNIEDRTSKLEETADDKDADAVAIKNLKDLVDIKEKLEGPKYRWNPNSILGAVASIGGIAMILVFEKSDVLSSKALSFVNKIKL